MNNVRVTAAGSPAARILVVEDDSAVRDFYMRVLRLHGYDVTSAENGRIAIQRCSEREFDLVLSDVQMPEMGGIALLEYLRAHGIDADVIILTAFAAVETAQQSLRAGAYDYMIKPVSMEDLERSVRRCLETRRIRKEKERLSELLTMYQFSQRIAGSLDIESQVQQISELVAQRFAPESITLSLVQPDDGNLLLIIATGIPGLLAGTSTVLAEHADEQAILACHQQLIGASRAASDIGRSAVHPLRTNDRSVGVLRLTRGPDQPAFGGDERKLLSVLATQIAASLENARLYEALKEQNLQTIAALAAAIDARDPYTRGHSEAVMWYAVRLAQRLGMPPEQIERIRYGALLHDIGKIGIRDHILLKPDGLTNEEFEMMKRHTVIGADIIRNITSLRHVIPMAELHHERMDGKGYPRGVAGNDFPTEARILSIADAFDAMTSDRAYRKGMKHADALQQLRRGRNIQWDGDLVDVFIEMIEQDGASLKLEERPPQAVVPR